MEPSSASITIQLPHIPEIARSRSLWTTLKDQFHMRGLEDDDEQDWWFASTAIPLIAATTAPLANVMSITALVMPWRDKIVLDAPLANGQLVQLGYSDPRWCVILNAISLVCGVSGNLFLLFNFTQTVRYIIALPASILLWFLATGILIGITAAMPIYDPPIPPGDVFSQGYWSAVIAAVLYFILCSILMVNMFGYFLGHYPQRFSLTEDQRTLILQTTFFVTWLIVGAAIFHRVMNISFADALYFSDVTILTLGFGDITAKTTLGRGLIMPYSVVGVVSLGLVVSSIHRFARELHYNKVVRGHLERRRLATVERSVTIGRDSGQDAADMRLRHPATAKLSYRQRKGGKFFDNGHPHLPKHPVRSTISAITRSTRPKLLVMREEKDRFDAMREIQRDAMRFRHLSDLSMSIAAYGIVWTCGALVFWKLDNITYFEALYFGFVCLLTIGYGDITPTTNRSRPFFVVWSLIAVPTMTILISEMSDTVVAAFKQGTDRVADWTILPDVSKFRTALLRFSPIVRFLERSEARKRIERGFQVGVDDVDATEGAAVSEKKRTPDRPQRTIEELARDTQPSDLELAQQLAFAIRRAMRDAVCGELKKYSYEEWVEFTRLIRFTESKLPNSASTLLDEDEQGVIDWDWIGENSPMLAERTEPEWVLERLCESMIRFTTNLQKQSANEQENDDGPTLLKARDIGLVDDSAGIP